MLSRTLQNNLVWYCKWQYLKKSTSWRIFENVLISMERGICWINITDMNIFKKVMFQFYQEAELIPSFFQLGKGNGTSLIKTKSICCIEKLCLHRNYIIRLFFIYNSPYKKKENIWIFFIKVFFKLFQAAVCFEKKIAASRELTRNTFWEEQFVGVLSFKLSMLSRNNIF